jgi:hypothetical protein
MKIVINNEELYISWTYDDFIGKQTANSMIRGVITTCRVKKKVQKPEEGQKAENPVILSRSIRISDATKTTKYADRRAALNKLIKAWTTLTKEQIAYIWNTYIKSQHGNISNNKMKLKHIVKLVGKLDAEQKEAIRSRFFEQPAKKDQEGKVLQMPGKIEEVVQHA